MTVDDTQQEEKKKPRVAQEDEGRSASAPSDVDSLYNSTRTVWYTL